ncbi:GNAT family N-acetyltransferase [Nocardioides marinquilinus]|uniref:GNAT family N-acetyltransferase n=1 Tax=Nocardioides marinquilinus TaxID=1210400 RepID=A0ABP9Q7H2_9ACTN
MVGAAELSLLGPDNPHLAELEVAVAPAHQRAGVGRSLWRAAREAAVADGRDTVVGEVYASPDSGGAALAFATAMGAVSVHQEEHLALELDRAATPPDPDAARDGYTVVAWGGRCPDEHLAAYARLRTRMEHDVPQGELDRRPIEVTEERVRAREGRLSPSYDSLVAAARHVVSGELVGYTQLLVPHGETEVVQDDTLVEPEHRGHGLGARLKRVNLARLRVEHPGATAVHTWTAPDNAPMLRTNLALGFVVVERMHEVQARLGEPPRR